MENSVELWVCPNCEVLQGIEITFPPDSTKMQANCLNCGVRLTMEEVHFLNPLLVKQVYSYVMEKLVDLDPDEIRFSWVSNRTVGLIFELSRSEIEELTQTDLDELAETLEKQLDLSVTVFFEL